jgi:hypothetical protein
MANESRMKISFTGTKISTAKTEFAAQLAKINPTLRAAVKNGAAKPADRVYYATRACEGNTSIEIMQASDAQTVGLTNMNKRMLDANNYALLVGVQLLSATAATADAALTAAFDTINDTLANGDFELEIGNKTLIPRSSNQIFKATPNQENKGLKGYYKLECPKLLTPLTEIVPTIYLPKAAPVNTYVKVILHTAQLIG